MSRSTRRHALPTTLALLLTSAALAAGATSAAWPPPGEAMPVELIDGHFVLDAETAAGATLRLFTDTGGGLAVRASTVERLGGDPEAATWELPPLADPAVPVPPRPLHVMPEERVPPSMPDGLLGAPWFAGRVWTFDYPGERLLLHDASPEIPAELRPHSVELGFQRGDDGTPTTSFPRITVRLAGEPVDLLLDTGATGTAPAELDGGDGAVSAVSFIVASRAAAWRAAHPEWAVVEPEEDGPLWIEVPEVEVAGHDVGPVWFVTRPDANFHDYMSQWMDRQVDGALGGNALRGLTVTVDYPRARAVFAAPAPAGGGVSLRDLDRSRRLYALAFNAFRRDHDAEAGRLFAHAAELAPHGAANAHYNAACGFALAGDADRALDQLRSAVRAGQRDPDLLLEDTDLASLHDDARWPGIVAAARSNRESNDAKLGSPANARLVTADVDRFWRAYDRAAVLDDADARAAVFAHDYLEPGSPGLLDFYLSRIGSARQLADFVSAHRDYYDAVRGDTLRAADAAAEVRRAFARLEALYPDAIFPDVYFVIGRLTSGGTTGPSGLLIGTEMFAVGPRTPAAVVPQGAERMVKPVAQLPYIVAHELVHYQQHGGGDGLLARVLREGSADFVAELMLDAGPLDLNYLTWGRAHARQVWERFQRDRAAEADGADRIGDWLYNYAQDDPDWHADLGYSLGYEISKAYWQQADDKPRALAELLALDDPEAILAASGYGERFAEP